MGLSVRRYEARAPTAPAEFQSSEPRSPGAPVKILHTVAGLWVGSGGPVASVTSLCRETVRRGHEVCLLTGDGAMHPAVNELAGRVRVRLVPLGPYWRGHSSVPFRKACRDEAGRADVIHDHGVWLQTNWASAWAARDAAKPLVRSPRGMLSPWALSRSSLRKRILWRLVERRLFVTAAVVHATSRLEEEEVRSLGVARRLEVIANGIDTDGEYAAARVAAARASAAQGPGAHRRILFLSRVHPKKGLDLLCEAWVSLPSDSPAELLIAGDGAASAVADVEQWVAQQPGPPARYLGPVTGEEKLRLLASAWALALPSQSENYGMVVAEALACGTPVLTTTATPWADVVERECGWHIKPRGPDLSLALQEVLALSAGAHQAMRVRARRLIEEGHSLRVTGAKFEALYEQLVTQNELQRGSR